MKFKDVLSNSAITPEQRTAIEDALGDDFDLDMDWVPRTRLNKVIKQKNDLKAQLESRSKKDDGDDDEDDDLDDTSGSDTSGKSKQVPGAISEKEHKKALKLADEAKAKEINDLKIQYAALDKLRGAKARDPELVFNSLIDKTKLALDDKGALTGLDDQVTELTKAKDFLFDLGGGNGGNGNKNFKPGTGRSSGDDNNDKDTALDSKLGNIFSRYESTDVVVGGKE